MENEKLEINQQDNSNENNLPSWIRYLPNPPWNSMKIHQKLHNKEEKEEKEEKRVIKKNNQKNEELILSSNPFSINYNEIEKKKKRKKNENNLKIEEIIPSIEIITPAILFNEENNTNNNDNKEGEDDEEEKNTNENERKVKRRRKVNYNPHVSMDEMSLLVSYCKVQKDL